MEPKTVENPTAAPLGGITATFEREVVAAVEPAPRTTTRADVEAAKEAAAAGRATQAELLAVVDAYFEEEVQQLRSEFTPTAQLETFVFNIHARLTEAPTSALAARTP